MARLAGHGACAFWFGVGCVGASRWPRIVSATVARTAFAAAIAQIDVSVHVKRGVREQRARAVRFAMAIRTRAFVVRQRWRCMAVVAPHRRLRHARPRRSGSPPRAGMARPRAALVLGIELRFPSRLCVVEPNLDGTIRVSALRDAKKGRRVAGAARHSFHARRARFGMRGVGRRWRIPREKAAIPRWIGASRTPVAGSTSECSCGLDVACGACGSAVGGKDHVGGPCGSTFVASATRVDVGGVQHRAIAFAAKELPMALGRTRVDERSPVHSGA